MGKRGFEKDACLRGGSLRSIVQADLASQLSTTGVPWHRLSALGCAGVGSAKGDSMCTCF